MHPNGGGANAPSPIESASFRNPRYQIRAVSEVIRAPLTALHRRHISLRFSTVSGPPSARGRTWSTVRSDLDPQVGHRSGGSVPPRSPPRTGASDTAGRPPNGG